MGAAAVPIALLAVAAASTGYQINAANEQSDKADAAAASQKKDQDQLLKDQESQAKKLKDEQDATLASQSASLNAQDDKTRQRALAAGALGRSDTILTSPLGLTSAPASASKTLLGM